MVILLRPKGFLTRGTFSHPRVVSCLYTVVAKRVETSLHNTVLALLGTNGTKHQLAVPINQQLGKVVVSATSCYRKLREY